MKKVITTVGTSLFTNYLKTNKDIQRNYEYLLNLANGDWEQSKARVERIRQAVSGSKQSGFPPK